MVKAKAALHIFNLRDEIEKDLSGTLAKVAKMGYQAVEVGIAGPLAGISAKELKKMLDDVGLEVSSSHMVLPFSELAREIEFNLEIGSKFIVSACGPQNPTDEVLAQYCTLLSLISEQANKHGLQHLYHNHDFEFQQRHGKYMLDEIYETVDADLLKAQIDVYWAKKGGVDPTAYLLKYKGRCPLIHAKDMTGDGREFFAEVGHGIIDFPSIFTAAEEIGIEYYIVEQDACERPPLESVKMSIDYLKSCGIV